MNFAVERFEAFGANGWQSLQIVIFLLPGSSQSSSIHRIAQLQAGKPLGTTVV
jgi:hypothetical protein